MMPLTECGAFQEAGQKKQAQESKMDMNPFNLI